VDNLLQTCIAGESLEMCFSWLLNSVTACCRKCDEGDVEVWMCEELQFGQRVAIDGAGSVP
jgi:hypothetical protein